MPHDHHSHDVPPAAHGSCGHSHSHGHGGHHHHHHLSPGDMSRRFVIAALLNCAFVVVELTAGIISKSMALVADALHNFSDVIGLLLAWAGVWLMRLAPTMRRTYGYRSASYLTALANAGLLLLATGAMVLESFRRFFEPAEVATGPVVAVGLLAIAVNTGTALMFWHGQKDDINIRGAFLHMAADAAVSAGVVISALLMAATGWLWFDPLMGLLIAAIIIWSSVGLAREALDMALGAVPSHIDPAAVAAYLRGLDGVEGVHDLHIWSLSTTDTALTAHLLAPRHRGDDDFLRRVCAELQDKFKIGHATLQIETDREAAACVLTEHSVL